jgi:hypothetical protein
LFLEEVSEHKLFVWNTLRSSNPEFLRFSRFGNEIAQQVQTQSLCFEDFAQKAGGEVHRSLSGFSPTLHRNHRTRASEPVICTGLNLDWPLGWIMGFLAADS